MRLFRRLLIILVPLIAIVLIFVPPLIGYGIEKFVGARMLLKTIQNQPDIRIISYKRHWFTTDITVAIKANDPSIRAAIAKLAPQSEDLPDPIEIQFTEHFQHGPVFYHPLANIPYHFGVALIDRKLVIPENEKFVLSLIGLNESIWKMNHAYISFTTKIFEYLELTNFNFQMRGGKANISFDSLVGNVWVRPTSGQLVGVLTLNNFTLNADKTSISLPFTTLYFNIKKDKNGLWIGSHSLELSKILLLNTIKDKIEIGELKFDGFIEENAGLLEVEKGFSIQSISFAEQDLGPLNVQLSANHLNAHAVADLINTYQDVKSHGELYESQLRQQLLSKLPYVVAPGASIQLDNFVFATPVGNLVMHAKLEWPTDHFIAPADISDLIDSSSLQGTLKMTSQLANQIIKFFSKLIYIREIPVDERNYLLDLEEQIRLGTQQNIVGINDLIQSKDIPAVEGKQLLKLVHHDASSDEYFAAIKKIYLDKVITRDVNYELAYLYSDLGAQVDEEKRVLKGYQQATEQQMHSQLDDYLKQGYVVKDDNDNYVVTFERQHGQIKVSGHPVTVPGPN